MKRWAVLASALAVCGSTWAQSAPRDPMQPPPEMRAAASAPGADAGGNALPWSDEGATILVRDGRPLLAVGTRTYAPGQRLGQYVIERITETEVVLREGKKTLRTVPVYAGIQRRAVPPAPP